MASSHICLILLMATEFVPSVSGRGGYIFDIAELTYFIEDNDLQAGREKARVVDQCKNKGTDCGEEIPESYAGFFLVNKSLDINYFIWYFPSQNQSAPLLLYISGGPGTSTIKSMLEGNGPIKPRPQTPGGRDVSAEIDRREGSWVESFSMLYIDHPLYTGYSHSRRAQARVNPNEYTADLFECVRQFYQLFPDLLSKDLYVGGEAYAGKYIPRLANRIHNENLDGTSSIPLKGIYLLAPFFNPKMMFRRVYDLYYEFGLVGKEQKRNLVLQAREYLNKQQKCDWNTSHTVSNLYRDALSFNVPYENYQSNEQSTLDRAAAIMNSDRLHTACNAGIQRFITKNETLLKEHYSEMFSQTRFQLTRLLNSGKYKILIANGDLDLLVSTPMVEEALLGLYHWDGRHEYSAAPREQWRGPEIDNVRHLYGHYTYTDSLCRVVVRKAGHSIAKDRLDVSRAMMLQFTQNGCVNTEYN